MLAGKGLNIFTQELVTPFWMEEYFTKGMCNWVLFLMCIQYIQESAWELYRLSSSNITN